MYVARRLGRRSVGIDLRAEYLGLAAKRLAQQELAGGGVVRFAAGIALGFCAGWLSALAIAGTAQGHTDYKGHNCTYWNVSIPSGVMSFSECYRSGSEVAPHKHDYTTRSRINNSGPYNVVHIHWGRIVPNTHPV